MRRVVLHVDMDAFFASVAQRDDPSLRGRPMAVGGHSVRRGVITSASYEARKFGVKSAMPIYQALALCPELAVVPSDMDAYRVANVRMREIWERHAPLVEIAGFDEAYIELTGCEALLGDPVAVARRIQADTLAETGLHCSVGIGPNKLLAKVASKKDKPRGLCAVPEGQEVAWLAGLAIGDLHGVGPAMCSRLAAIGLTRVWQLQQMDVGDLERAIGPGARELAMMALGHDPRPLVPHSPPKSIGAETTFDQDLVNSQKLVAIYRDLVQEVAYRTRRAGYYARTVTTKIRYRGFETITRARTLPQATDDDDVIAAVALDLWRTHAEPGRPIRLIGVTLSHFTTTCQLSWLGGAEPGERRALNVALDALRERHGLFVVGRGTHLERRRDRAAAGNV